MELVIRFLPCIGFCNENPLYYILRAGLRLIGPILRNRASRLWGGVLLLWGLHALTVFKVTQCGTSQSSHTDLVFKF